MTIEEYATVSRRLVVVSFASAFSMFMTGCNVTSDDHSSGSVQDLKKYIDFPDAATSVRWELVTLPESHGSWVPGPTDWIVLLAVIYIDKPARHAYLSRMNQTAPSGALPTHFMRKWMPQEIQVALNRLPKEGRDARVVVRRPSLKQALAGEFEDGVVVYVEYTSP